MPEPRELLAAAGLQPGADGELEVSVGGRSVSVGVRSQDLLWTLEARALCQGLTTVMAQEVTEALDAESVAAPGDTSLRADGAEVVGARRVADPSPQELRTSVHSLAKSVASASADLERRAGLLADLEEIGRSEAPAFRSTVGEIQAAVQDAFPMVTVSAAQPGWQSPDPASRVVEQLQAGGRYQLLARQGDWAKVLSEAGLVSYTDGRALVRLP